MREVLDCFGYRKAHVTKILGAGNPETAFKVLTTHLTASQISRLYRRLVRFRGLLGSNQHGTRVCDDSARISLYFDDALIIELYFLISREDGIAKVTETIHQTTPRPLCDLASELNTVLGLQPKIEICFQVDQQGCAKLSDRTMASLVEAIKLVERDDRFSFQSAMILKPLLWFVPPIDSTR